jgi:RNA polymerase sigma-70 factor (ECF subfamily)
MAVAPEASPTQLAAEESETAEQLFEEHSGWIYGYCLRVLRSPEEAEDALQTTYLNACRSLNRGTRPQQGSAWLLRIAQNVCVSRLRSSGRRGTFEHAQDAALIEATAAAPDRVPDDLVGLTDALHGMPEQQRKAILLREWQGLSYQEIASELGITQSAVETLIFRARRSLAAGLESPPKRSRLRSLYAVDLGGLAAAIKGLFAGSAGVKAVAALTVAAATTTTLVATDPGGVLSDRHSERQARAQAASSKASPEQSIVATPIVEDDVSTVPVEPRLAWPGEARDQEKTKAPSEKPKAKASGNANGHGNGQGPSENGNTNGNGRAGAPGQAKKAENAPDEPGGHGSAQGGRPDHAGQGGPPPHAQANAPEKSKKVKESKK